MGTYFDTVLKPRIQKTAYSKDWSEGKPVSREGISHCLKYIRLESFEDTLNNLQLPDTQLLNTSSPDAVEMARDYLLKYWLEFETAGSPSLLNVREFADPTSYKLKVKQAGSDAQVEKTIDLVETFNWLIGLHVAHLDQPRRYAIELVRETDPELPKDQDTRWRSTAIKERDDGEFWFRAVEGHILSVPGDDLSRERVLVIWRKLTSDSGRDQAALEAWLNKRGINPRESEYAFIYVNGNHALPSDGDAATRVRLIEETFAQRMWDLQAKNLSLTYSATMEGGSLFMEAWRWGYVGLGVGLGTITYLILATFGLPTLLVFGAVHGLGQGTPGAIPFMFAGACLGRFYFRKKFGDMWMKYTPVMLAGFSCGMGLVAMVAVGFTILTKMIAPLLY